MGYLNCNADSAIAVCDPSYYNKTKKNHHKTPKKIRRFTYSDLESATNNFSPRNLLGKGSHGTVYKAVLDNGKLIAAVKKTTSSNFITTNLNTNTTTTSAENEIEILSKIHSSRIVNLIGYAVQHSSTTAADHHKNNSSTLLLLVVQYMPNGSLYDILHKTPPNAIPTLAFRIRAALQVAKSLHTLHTSTPPIIHRDVKSSNILLSSNHNARLSDFGLALRGQIEDVHILSTPPAGTLGYLDPTYLSPSDLTTKSDVFSYGILLLEIISGRRAIDVNYSPPSVIDWALPLIKDGRFSEICDRRIRRGVDGVVFKELGLLILRCVRSTARKRVSMGEVVDCLKVIYKWVKVPAVWSNLRWRVRNEGRRRVGGVDGDDDKKNDDEEERVTEVGVEEWARSSRFGGKRTLTGRGKKKVSSVSSLEEIIVKSSTTTNTRDGGGGGDRILVGRSKSAGAGSYHNNEIISIESGGNGNRNGKVISTPEDDVGSKCNHRHHKVSLMIKGRKSGEVSVRVSTSRVKLSKSRSMSVLYGNNKDKKNIINGGQVRNSINGGQVREIIKRPSIKEELDELPLLENAKK